MEKIDFVLPWVDDTRPEWNAARKQTWNKYYHVDQQPADDDDSNGSCRYRDMGILEYWFRSVEKFAPWVNKVYFVTCGQKPAWLNENHPKLVLVNHKDYIPEKYLPTFNANPIELNLHRIPGLSEHFVYFNDDMFLIRPASPELFFVDGQPCLPCDLTPCDYFGYNTWSFICLNDYFVLNDSFDIHDAIWKNRCKWFNVKHLGIKKAMKNFLCYKINRTMSIRGYDHLATAQLKSTFQEAWDTCPGILEDTSSKPFRTREQVNQWLLCGWNQAKGAFHPVLPNSQGCHFNVSTACIDEVCSIIRKQSIPQICLNDSEHNDNPERCFREIRAALDSILPEKSGFEL